MISETELRSRQIASEIDAFAGRGIPAHAAAMIWRNVEFLGPMVEQAFGAADLHSAYARTIAEAIARTGNPTVYSLGCGEGAEELTVLRRADALGLPPFRIIGLELSPITGARAMAAAAAAGMADRLVIENCDLNTGLPGHAPIGAVMAHHTLHHIVGLEGLFDSIATRLEDEGSFVTFDMIGRNGHRRWPEVMGLIRRLWPMLPADRQYDHIFARPMPRFQDWDCAIQGFEGVRAQDILRLIAERFDAARFVAWGGLSETFLNYRTAPSFDPADATDRIFLSRIQQLESALLEARCTTPTEMAAEFRPRRSRMRRDPLVRARFLRAVRQPGEVFPSLEEVAFASPYPPQPDAVPPILPCGVPLGFAKGTPAAAALFEGFEQPDADGVWALLDEQFLRLRTEPPAGRVTLTLWSFLPGSRSPGFTAQAAGCAMARSGPLDGPRLVELVLEGASTSQWDIRIAADAYRLPDLEGGADIRPLAYRLVSLRADV